MVGGAHRLGRAIALDLAEAGADVAISYHTSAHAAEATRAEIAALGAGVHGWEVGEPVAVYGPWGCGRCRQCRVSAENNCERAAELRSAVAAQRTEQVAGQAFGV